MSNLNDARALIQADLDHARHVVELWTNQIAELEKALEQLGAVDVSRSALQVEYQGAKGSAAVLAAPVAMKDVSKPRRGRKPKNAASANGAAVDLPAARRRRNLAESSTVAVDNVSEKKRGRAANKTAAKKVGRSKVAKYKDPNSEKTWSGLGRPPAWMQGDREQFEIGAGTKGNASEASNGSNSPADAS